MVTLHKGERHASGDGRRLPLELFGRRKGVTPARDEETRDLQSGEVLGAEPLRLPRRMQGIADQHERGGFEAVGDRHGAHAPTEGAPADRNFAEGDLETLGQRSCGTTHGVDAHGRRVGAAFACSLPGELDALDSNTEGCHRGLDRDEARVFPPGAGPRGDDKAGDAGAARHRDSLTYPPRCESVRVPPAANVTDWRDRLAREVGRLGDVRPLSANAWAVEARGQKLVAKVGPGARDEADGLGQLASVVAGSLVPAVVFVDDELVVTVAVVQAARTSAHDESLGRSLAALHAAPFAHWGGGSSWIGACPVDASTWPDAVAFYGARLRELSERCGLQREVERVVTRLPELLPTGGPALLHGDLWWGNVLFGADGTTWLIDPSVHGGHREEDLAMLGLFGTVPDRLLAAYQEVAPLEPGWPERIALFQLSPLLVHAVLFGQGYRAQAEAVARRFA